MTQAHTFTLSIEETAGKARMHGFHLGTDPRMAYQIAAEIFHNRVKHGHPVVTVALMRQGRLVDCYDGHWFNAGSR